MNQATPSSNIPASRKKQAPKRWKRLFQELLEEQFHGRRGIQYSVSGLSRRGGSGGGAYTSTIVNAFHEDADPGASITEQDYVILALANLHAVLESLEEGNPRSWSDTSDPWRTERAFREWRQDVWWMFYQKDPFCAEPFSLESCCSHLADAFKITLAADAVRESCFRAGMCPPESKISKRRRKRARIMVLSKVGQGGPSK